MAKDTRHLEEEGSAGVLSELWGFMAHNKKWWLAPLVLMLLLFGGLLVIGASGAAPFIYTLF